MSWWRQTPNVLPARAVRRMCGTDTVIFCTIALFSSLIDAVAAAATDDDAESDVCDK